MSTGSVDRERVLPAASDPLSDVRRAVSAPTRFERWRRETHWVFVMAISAITVAAGLLGWHLRSDDPPPAIPNPRLNLAVWVGTDLHPSSYKLYETLLPSLQSSEVRLDLSLVGPPPPTGFDWTVVATALHGTLCPGAFSKVATHSLPHDQTKFTGHSDRLYSIPDIDTVNVPLFELPLCLAEDGPAVLHGSYLAAGFPTAEIEYPDSVFGAPGFHEQEALRLAGTSSEGDLAVFSLQAGQPPDVIAPNQWTWNRTGDGDGNFAPNVFYAANVSGLQRDSQNAFISGVVLGIAGAGLLTVLQELILSAYRRER